MPGENMWDYSREDCHRHGDQKHHGMDTVEKEERKNEHPAIENNVIERSEKLILYGCDVICELRDIAADSFPLECAQVAGEYPAQQFLAHCAGDRRVDVTKNMRPTHSRRKTERKIAPPSASRRGISAVDSASISHWMT